MADAVNLDGEVVARAAYEAVRAVGAAHGSAAAEPWAELPQWRREGETAVVHLARLGETAESLHDRWREWRWSRGWTYGETLSCSQRTDPCLLPFGELPAARRAKYVVFHAVVGALTSAGRTQEATRAEMAESHARLVELTAAAAEDG